MLGLLISLVLFWLYKSIDGQLWYNNCREEFMRQFNLEEQSRLPMMELIFSTKPEQLHFRKIPQNEITRFLDSSL